jgi:hypothetical protein
VAQFKLLKGCIELELYLKKLIYRQVYRRCRF